MDADDAFLDGISAGYLRKYLPLQSDEPECDLLPEIEKALRWIEEMQGRRRREGIRVGVVVREDHHVPPPRERRLERRQPPFDRRGFRHGFGLHGRQSSRFRRHGQ